MSSESVCQVASSWVDVGSFHARLVVRFMICTASVRNILDTTSYVRNHHWAYVFFSAYDVDMLLHSCSGVSREGSGGSTPLEISKF
jgi:hypothetical protein